jgi:hypothetical protein
MVTGQEYYAAAPLLPLLEISIKEVGSMFAAWPEIVIVVVLGIVAGSVILAVAIAASKSRTPF